MSDTRIKIENCNNIKSGEITVQAGKLNILFGYNGTGKSTIAQAINLCSQNESLTKLTPYENESEDNEPTIEGVPAGNIAIFDDEYISRYVFQSKAKTIVENSFQVFIRSKEYDKAEKNINDALSRVKGAITDRREIADLKHSIDTLLDKIKLTTTGRVAKRGGAKSVLDEGKGAYCNPPEELRQFKSFFEDAEVSKWVAWRLQGYKLFGEKGRCPYCSIDESAQTKTQDRVFADSFDKASVEAVAAIQQALEALAPYIDGEKASKLVSCFGVKGDLAALNAQLEKLCAEADYLSSRLTNIVEFNGSSVDRDSITELETELLNMKIDLGVCDTYFVSDMFKAEMGSINTAVDKLLKDVDDLKGEIGKYNSYIQNNMEQKKHTINEFLRIAGFKYTFDVEIYGENNARALLRFTMPDGSVGDVSYGRHLSWGERNAFALILFMFDAASRDPELVILDDPISSFDGNKKYAIIDRLFGIANKMDNFCRKTVLMLTHDFQPVIDYVQVGAGRDPSAVCASYFENDNGRLRCEPIEKDVHLMSSVVLLKELALDKSIDIAARIACLRKFIEHQYGNPLEESMAYNILSSLVHGRSKPTFDKEGKDKLDKDQILIGKEFIKKFIPDFKYASALDQCAPDRLIDRYNKETSAYVKMLILRAYSERDDGARKRLGGANDVLRKYVDETFHIENDYLYSLDVRHFNIVPENYIVEADRYMAGEQQRGLEMS